MAELPPIIFEVTFVVPQEMRWCMRAKGIFDDWLMFDAASARPVDQLPAADLQMQIDHCELRLRWIELEAANAWEAIKRASVIVEEVLPDLLKVRRISAEATMQNPDPDTRRPVGT